MFLNALYSVILGVIQGITEFLPVSSSGHLAVLQKNLSDFAENYYFIIVVHLATTFSVIIFLRNEIIAVLKLFKDPFKKSASLLHYLVLSTVITVIIAFIFREKVKTLFGNLNFIAIAFLITGIFNIISQLFISRKNSLNIPDAAQAVLVGVLQGFAIIPGISRSGATIMGSLALKKDPLFSFNFSFLLSIPAIIGGFIFVTLDKSSSIFLPIYIYIIGFIVSFFAGYFSLKILKKMIISKYFFVFGIYTILLGTIILLRQI